MDRSYRGPGSVGRAYDVWTADGVLERHWGEHIHHGYYPARSFRGIDFKAAKLDLARRLLDHASVEEASQILDVGCGIGGSSRYLARRFGADTLGVTLSESQAARARQLSDEGGRSRFEVADALSLPFEDERFDLVWSCESGEHMPDKARFFSEMVRVLAPGGRLVLATWCCADAEPSSRERARLERIYQRWTLPPFIPLSSYRQMAEAAGLEDIRCSDWSPFVAPTWNHQLWLGVKDLPWLLRQGWGVVGRSVDDARAVRDMAIGLADGSVVYGVLTASKSASKSSP